MVSSGFELRFVTSDGVAGSCTLNQAREVSFEDCLPVRGFRWSKRLGHFPGWWWTATMGRHVGYESWLERDTVMVLDFDPRVVAVASQPFWLYWHDGHRIRRHAPDFFARRDDGVGVVVDVRVNERVEPEDAEAFEVTRRACEQIGWEFRRVGELDQLLGANVRWLARYRHPRCASDNQTAHRLLDLFADPQPLRAGAADAGDALRVLPVLFHMMWHGELVTDLAGTRLCSTSLVQRARTSIVVTSIAVAA